MPVESVTVPDTLPACAAAFGAHTMLAVIAAAINAIRARRNGASTSSIRIMNIDHPVADAAGARVSSAAADWRAKVAAGLKRYNSSTTFAANLLPFPALARRLFCASLLRSLDFSCSPHSQHARPPAREDPAVVARTA